MTVNQIFKIQILTNLIWGPFLVHKVGFEYGKALLFVRTSARTPPVRPFTFKHKYLLDQMTNFDQILYVAALMVLEIDCKFEFGLGWIIGLEL